jgi:hypothetical protein
VRAHATLILLLVAAAGCGGGGGATDSSTGTLRLTAVAGPTCPVQQAGKDCDPRPVDRAVVDVRSAGESVERLTISHGNASISLPPGSYTLVVEEGSGMSAPDPRTVRIRDGETSAVTLSFDTGIR